MRSSLGLFPVVVRLFERNAAREVASMAAREATSYRFQRWFVSLDDDAHPIAANDREIS